MSEDIEHRAFWDLQLRYSTAYNIVTRNIEATLKEEMGKISGPPKEYYNLAGEPCSKKEIESEQRAFDYLSQGKIYGKAISDVKIITGPVDLYFDGADKIFRDPSQ